MSEKFLKKQGQKQENAQAGQKLRENDRLTDEELEQIVGGTERLPDWEDDQQVKQREKQQMAQLLAQLQAQQQAQQMAQQMALLPENNRPPHG